MTNIAFRQINWQNAAIVQANPWVNEVSAHSSTPKLRVYAVADWEHSGIRVMTSYLRSHNCAKTLTLLCSGQFNAWCVNDGHHKTFKRRQVDWNALIIWKMRMELETQWQIVEDEVSTIFKELEEDVKARFGVYSNAISGEVVLFHCEAWNQLADRHSSARVPRDSQ